MINQITYKAYTIIVFVCAMMFSGCSNTKQMYITMNGKPNLIEKEYKDYCKNNDTLVIDAKTKISMNEITNITQKDAFTRFTGGLFGFEVGSLLGLGAAIPVGMIGCRNKSDEANVVGSDQGWCKATTVFVIVPIFAITGAIFGSNKYSSRINTKKVESCDENLHSLEKDYTETRQIKNRISRGGLYRSEK